MPFLNAIHASSPPDRLRKRGWRQRSKGKLIGQWISPYTHRTMSEERALRLEDFLDHTNKHLVELQNQD